jgi:hypothetical protein
MAARIETAGGGGAAVVGGGPGVSSLREAEVAALLAHSEPEAVRGRESLPVESLPVFVGTAPAVAEPRGAASTLLPSPLDARLESVLHRLHGRPSPPSFPGTSAADAATPRSAGLRGLAALGEPLGPPPTAAAGPGAARREGFPFPEPLREGAGDTDLAGQLDRLLRRQARRHGIDLETP